jgi:surfeit locus 1 family protein
VKLTARSLLLGALVVAATATCVRLGFWQLARMHYKHALHAAQRALLARPPLELERSLPATPPETGSRLRLRGRWESAAHVLLSGRTHLGAAGVSLVSAVRLASGEQVLVERGWIEAADSRTAHPERVADSLADASGVALPLERSPHPTPWVELRSERSGTRLWSARTLDADSAAARFGGTLAPWIVRELPGEARAAGAPIPEDYVMPDESMHLSYAIQWFGFALIIGLGSLALALRRPLAPRRPLKR